MDINIANAVSSKELRTSYITGFPGGSDSKESAYNARDPGSIPWRRKWQPTAVLLIGKSHGWRSLAGCKEL